MSAFEAVLEGAALDNADNKWIWDQFEKRK